MSFSVGIIGLPNVGKSTLFKALTKKPIDIAPRPFTTIQPNRSNVVVPDEKLKKIAEIAKPEKISPTSIELVDIAGLVREAHKGAGLGNQFLAQIRNCQVLIEVIRIFENGKVEHVEEELDPFRDIEIVKTELLMKDLETTENALSKLEKRRNEREVQKKIQTLKEIKEALARGKKILETDLGTEKEQEIKEFQFLTQKPLILVFNKGERNIEIKKEAPQSLKLNLKLEEEMSELTENEAKELGLESELKKLILACYQALNLITFYTIAGGKEAKAWTLSTGSNAAQAGRTVHSDFEKFIKADVVNSEELIKAQSWKEAREKGFLKVMGRDYLVQDGDVIEFKI